MSYNFEKIVNRENCQSHKMIIMQENEHYDPNVTSQAFSVADLDFECMTEIKDAIIDWTNKYPFGYIVPSKEYYEIIIDFMKRHHNLDINTEEILIYPGVIPMIEQIIKAFTSIDDEVIIFSPVYHPFSKTILNSDRKVCDVPLINTNGNYSINFNEFEKQAQRSETKALLFCSPHNPVGRVWTKEEFKEIGRICIENNLLIISDEIHFDFVNKKYNHHPILSVSKEIADISFLLTAPSKTFNLAGLKNANLIIKNKELRDKLLQFRNKLSGQSPVTLGLVACKAAYTYGDAWIKDLNSLITANYEFIKDEFSKRLPKAVVSELQGTYLLWVDLREYGLAESVLEKLNKNQVFVNDGSKFGESGRGFIRINIAFPKAVVEDLVDRVVTALS